MFPLTALLEVGGKLIDKLIPDPEAKAKAQLDLAKMAQDGELAKMANETEIYKTEQNNVTARWTADANTDSWLSKNIRPMSLVATKVCRHNKHAPLTKQCDIAFISVISKGAHESK